MITKPCKQCTNEIDFRTGISSAVGNQPLRSHATCPRCGTQHYIMVDNPDLYDGYREDDRVAKDPELKKLVARANSLDGQQHEAAAIADSTVVGSPERARAPDLVAESDAAWRAVGAWALELRQQLRGG